MQQPKYHPLTGLKLEPIWVSPSGRTFWPVMGGDDTVPPAVEPPVVKAEDKPAEKLLTQAEVSAIAAKEKNEGKAAAERAIAEQLGVSVTEAAAIIKAAKDADEATKTESQKDRDKAAKEKSDAEADRAAAREEVHQARLERAFGREGLDLEADDEKSKRLLRLVTAESGASYEDILAEVKTLKSDFPALFDAVAADPKKKAPSGDPKGNPPKPTGGEDKFAKGAERAKARYVEPTWDPLAKK